MALIIPNTTTQDAYDPSTTFAGSDVFAGGYFTVANNPVAVQLAVGELGQAAWQDEQYLPPATYPIVPGGRRPISGLRFRSFIAGTPAQVFGGLVYPGEPSIQAGTPYSATIAPSGAVSGQLSLIQQFTLAAAAPNIDFQNIPATFNALEIVWYARCDAAALSAQLRLRVNNDATGNYVWQTLSGSGAAAVAAESGGAVAQLNVGDLTGATAAGGLFSGGRIFMPGYTLGNIKTVIANWVTVRTVLAGGITTGQAGGFYGAGTVPNRLTLFPNAPNFVAGTAVQLYGYV